MRQLTMEEVAAVDGGYASSSGWAGDAILTASGAIVGFCFGGPAGAWVGGSAGHALAMIMID